MTTPQTATNEEQNHWTSQFAGETNKEAFLATEHVIDLCEEIDNDCDHFQNVIAEC